MFSSEYISIKIYSCFIPCNKQVCILATAIYFQELVSLLAVNRNIKVPSLRFQERCIRVFMARYIYEAHELLNWYLGLPLILYISIQAIFKAFYYNDNKIVEICQTMTSEHLFLATFVLTHLHDVQIGFAKLVVFSFSFYYSSTLSYAMVGKQI